MPATFADRKLFDPGALYDWCLRRRLPTDWHPLVNRYRNPIGTASGAGAVLMLRKDLDEIDLFTTHDLVLDDGANPKVTLRKLHVAGPTTCLSPGHPDDPDAVHLVPLADHRRLWRLTVLNAAYNLRLTPTGGFAEATLNGEQLWTWQEMVDDIKDAIPAAYAPGSFGLPVVPEVDPEGFAFHGTTAADALAHVLARLGCDVALDLTQDSFTVVELGGQQAALPTYETRYEGRRLWDREPVQAGLGRGPARVQVFFRKQPTRAYGNTQFWTVTVGEEGDARDGETGTVLLHDDMIATYQGGNLTNGGDLQARAEERAEEYFAEHRDHATKPHRRIYSGALDGIRPGPEIAVVTWQDRGDTPFADGTMDPLAGITTEVERQPLFDPVEEWPGNPEQPWRLTEILDVTQTDVGVYWEAKVVRWNVATEAWEELFDCLYYDINGQDPPPAGRYVCVFKGYSAADELPVYAGGCCPTGDGGGGSTGPGDPNDDPPADPGTLSIPCCPDRLMPETLFAFTFNHTGDCTCVPEEIELVYEGFAGSSHTWTGSYEACGGCALTLQCTETEGVWNWQLGPASCAAGGDVPPDGPDLISVECGDGTGFPFTAIFHVNNSIGGATNCTGTYDVIITE